MYGQAWVFFPFSAHCGPVEKISLQHLRVFHSCRRFGRPGSFQISILARVCKGSRNRKEYTTFGISTRVGGSVGQAGRFQFASITGQLPKNENKDEHFAIHGCLYLATRAVFHFPHTAVPWGIYRAKPKGFSFVSAVWPARRVPNFTSCTRM
jgi:hypothetical protein